MESEVPIDITKTQVFLDYLSGHPSLQKVALVSLAARFWNEAHVRHFIHEAWKEIDILSYYSLETCLYNAKEILLLELDKVHIPPTLRKKLEKIISGFGFHLFNFLIDINKNHANMDVFLGQNIPIYFKIEGRIDKAKTLNALMIYETNPENLVQNTSKSELFKLACHYCLEEYVSVLWLSLNTNEQNLIEQAYPKDNLVPYWIAVQKNKLSGFVMKAPRHDPHSLYDQNFNFYQNGVSFSIYEGNELAFKYFWDQLSSKIQPIYQWLEILLRSPSMKMIWAFKFTVCTHAYILCFLLSQDLDYQKRFFQDPSYFTCLLHCLYNVWPLQKYYLPTMGVLLSYHLEDINPDFSDTPCVEYKAIQKGKTKEKVFKDAWGICPSEIQKNLTRILDSTPPLIIQIMAISNIEIVWLLLNAITNQEKKGMVWRMFAYFSFYFCIPSKWELMDELLLQILRDNNDILLFKIKAGIKYAENYWICGQHDCRVHLKPLEGFITWAFPFNNEISNLAEIDLKYRDETSEMLEMYLDFDLDLKIKPLKIYSALILYNNYELANKFLNQYFNTENEISMFKDSLSYVETIETVRMLLEGFCKMGETGWERFQTFINFTFSSAEIIDQFKSLHVQPYTIAILLQLSYRCNGFIFVTKLLDWSIASSVEIIKIKNPVMVSKLLVTHFYDSLLKLVQYDSVTDWMNLKEKIIWFQPTNETLDYLKMSLSKIKLTVETCEECGSICTKHNKKKIFFYLLESLMEENSHFNLEDILNQLSNVM